MPPSHRHMDICTGHGCYRPRPNAVASPNVFVNNRGQHRVGDAWMRHCCVRCHGGVGATGSPDVITNNRNSCRIGDRVSCGSNMATGSPDVIIN